MAKATKHKDFLDFCNFAQRIIVVTYRRSGTAYRSRLRGSTQSKNNSSLIVVSEDGADGLSRSVNKQISFCSAYNAKGAQKSFDPQRKTEMTQMDFKLRHIKLSAALPSRVSCTRMTKFVLEHYVQRNCASPHLNHLKQQIQQHYQQHYQQQ